MTHSTAKQAIKKRHTHLGLAGQLDDLLDGLGLESRVKGAAVEKDELGVGQHLQDGCNNDRYANGHLL